MRVLRENRIFILVILVAVIASSIACFQRMGVEAQAKTADIVIDYNEVKKLAEQSQHDTLWWLEEFQEMGVSQAGLQEESLLSLTQSELPVEASLLKDIRQEVNWQERFPAEFVSMIQQNAKDDFDVIAIAGSPEMADFLTRAFTQRYDPQRTLIYQGEDETYYFIDGTVEDSIYQETYRYLDTEGEGFTQVSEMASSKILYLNLGLLPEKVQIIEQAGMKVLPRTIEYSGWNDTRFARDVVEQYEAICGAPDYWIMAGTQVPGYEEGTDFIVDYLNEHDTIVGIVEDTTQRQNLDPDGLEALIEGTDYNTIRVFSVWGYIQNRYQYYGYEGPEEIDNSLFRAVVERNIRLIYYKPMKYTDDDYRYITDPQEYRDSLAALEERLAGHGIRIGPVKAQEPFFVSLWVKILAAIGAGTAALILLAEIFRLKETYKWALFALGCAGVLGAYYMAPNMAALLTSMGASVALPCLAAAFMMQKGTEIKKTQSADMGFGRLMLAGTGVLLACVLISLFGALMTAAPISDVNYMLELDIFRGVKAAQLLPLGFYALLFLMFYFYLWGDKKDSRLAVSDLKSLLFGNLKIWIVFVGMVMAAAGYVYLARTGHETNVSASTLELLGRNFLEEVLYARPRTKEFLIAFPAVILFVYSMVRNWKVFSFLFGTAGVIGFTSIVNTFMHIRTPLELGFVRTAYAVLFGIVLAIVYGAVLEWIWRLLKRKGIGKHA